MLWACLTCDILGDILQSLPHHFIVLVHVRAAEEYEGRIQFLLEHELADTSEEIEGARYTGVSTECH